MKPPSLSRSCMLISALAFCSVCCAGSPDPVFYALSSQSGRALASPPLRIEMRRAGLPGYLDRPHIVRRASAERLELAADERWGSPLDVMVSSTLADDLGARLPGCVVFSEEGAITTTADVRVEVEITRFELDATGTVQLQAGSAVRFNGGTDAVRSSHHAFSIRPASKSTADLVASMSRALAQLADALAQAVIRGAPTAVGESLESAPRQRATAPVVRD
ncbi:MAG TPA: PqiC family protein [Polyangiaceae bacterium]|nr:PqiC family protein [Polyangiaceae bacterium]